MRGDFARGREAARIDVFTGAVPPGHLGGSAALIVGAARRIDFEESDEYWNGYQAGLRMKGFI